MTIEAPTAEAAVTSVDIQARTRDRPGLLCVANFPANTGYAWEFIEDMYRGVAEALAPGVATWVAYPRMATPPATLEGSAARAVELDFDLRSAPGLIGVLAFVRKHRIRVVYLTDRASWDPAYVLLRMAGVRRIVVHDHTSGRRSPPTGLRRALKVIRAFLPGTLADRVLGVSDYVARRKIEVDCVPAARVRRIWNSRAVSETRVSVAARRALRAKLGLDEGPVIACACRATPEKGVAQLLRAFERCLAAWPDRDPVPSLIYIGEGPGLDDLRRLRSELASAARIHLLGYRRDAASLIGCADVCVVPSLWEEAFGLAALEPMTHGLPVIASRAGGLPEIVVDGVTGLLVPPGDEAALAAALAHLAADDGACRRMGDAGHERARALFSRERALAALLEELSPGFDAEMMRQQGDHV